MIHNGKIVDHYVVWVKYIPSLRAHLGKPIYVHVNYEGENHKIFLSPMGGNQPGWRSNFNFGNDRSKENWKPISLQILNEVDNQPESTLQILHEDEHPESGNCQSAKHLTEIIESAFAKNELSAQDCANLIKSLSLKLRILTKQTV